MQTEGAHASPSPGSWGPVFSVIGKIKEANKNARLLNFRIGLFSLSTFTNLFLYCLFFLYRWLTTLFYSQVCSQVVQLHIYTSLYIFSDSFLLQVIIGCWVQFPALFSKSLLFIYFMYGNVCLQIPYSLSLHTTFPFDNLKFAFYVCVSDSVL